MKLHVAALSDVGRERSHNEDAFLLWDLAHQRPLDAGRPSALEGEDAAYLLVVSDGMGGARSGEIASHTAIESLRDFATDAFHAARLRLGETDPMRWLARGVAESNQIVHTESQNDITLRGMGATLTAVALLDGELVVAHVGDSRAYLLRGARLRQLTMDHTHVQELVSIGQISSEEARLHRNRNLLLQAIGTGDSVDVDDLDVAVAKGDRLLLCSDGLHGPVDDEEIARVLRSDLEPREQCRALVDRANEGGGHDNITVIVAHLE